MNQGFGPTPSPYAGFGASAEQRNRVLRNTYWLLALSMVPTVLGAWIGLETGITRFLASGFIGAILFLAGAYGFIYAIQKNRNSSTGVYLLLAFTFFMGLMLSGLLSSILPRSNGAEMVMMAFSGTAAVLVGMASLSTVIKRDLSGMGQFLFIGTLMLIVAGLLNLFFNSTALAITLNVLCVGIFSAWILYDLKSVRDGHETSYISATLSVYLSLFNIFQSLLSLLGLSND